MKKGLIPILLVLAVFAGCSKSGSNTQMDSTGATQNTGVTPPAPPAPLKANVPASTTIMPAAANNGTPMVVTLAPPSGGTANNVIVAVYFTGGGTNATQTITVAIPGMTPYVFTSDPSHYNYWNTYQIMGTSAQQQVPITAAITGYKYTVTASPIAAGQPGGGSGVEVSTYTSPNGSAIVLVADVAATQP